MRRKAFSAVFYFREGEVVRDPQDIAKIRKICPFPGLFKKKPEKGGKILKRALESTPGPFIRALKGGSSGFEGRTPPF